MREIVLIGGSKAKVSDEHFEALKKLSWSLHSEGYAVCNNRASRRYMHQMVLELQGIPVPFGFLPDHQDRDPLNNQKENIKVKTRSQNEHNKGLRVDNLSGFKGISFCSKTYRWKVQIRVRGCKLLVGFYTCFEQAKAARLKAEKDYQVD